MPSLFADIGPEPAAPARRSVFADIGEDEDEFDDTGMFGEGNAETSARVRRGVATVGRAANYVGEKLGAVRRATYDPLVRGAARLAGITPAPVIEPDGKPRDPTAPELLEAAVMPARETGPRATSRQFKDAARDHPLLATNLSAAAVGLGLPPDAVPYLLGGLGDLDEFVAGHPSTARGAHLAEDVTRVPVKAATGFLDPLSIASGGSVVKAVGGGAKALAAAGRVDQALAATGVALGTTGAVTAAAKAHDDFVKGDIDAMLVDLAEMGTAGAMGLVARKGMKDIAAARAGRQAAVGTGKRYEFDPALTKAERAEITAAREAGEESAAAARNSQRSGAVADVAAMDPLDAAGLGRPEPTPGRTGAVSVEGEAPAVLRPGAAPDAVGVRIEDAAPGRARTDAGLVERQGPVGRTVVRDEGPAAVRMSPRARAVAAELGMEAEPIPETRATPLRTRTALQEKLAAAIAARRADAARAVSNQSTAARQRAAVAEAEAGVGPDHGQAERVESRATSMDDAYSQLEKLPGVGPELAGRHRAAEEAKETIAGKYKAPTADAARSIGADRFESEVAPALDGKADPAALKPDARAVYDTYRTAMDAALVEHNAARKAAGLPPLEREAAYFPRVPKGENLMSIEDQAAVLARQKDIPIDEAMQRLRGSDTVVASRADKKGAFERERTGDLAGRMDPAVVGEYFDVLARRTAELTHYGKNGEKIAGLLAQLPDAPKLSGPLAKRLPNDRLKIGDREFAQTFFDRTRNILPTGLGTQTAAAVRTLSGLHDLVWSAPRQLSSIAQTAMAGGVRGTAKGVWRTVAGEVHAADMKSPLRLASAIRRSVRKAGVESDRIAAVSHSVTSDLMSSSMTAKADPPSWIRAMLAADRGQRYVAVKTWEAVGPDLIAKAKSGNLAEQRSLERLGIDWKGTDPTSAADMATAAKRFSDGTQYRASIGTLPPWASSPGGRMAFQYLSFINAHTKTMKYVASEGAKGNVKPAARFISIGLPIALATNAGIDFLKGYGFSQEEITDANLPRRLAEELTGKTSSNPFRGKREAAVVLARGLSALGIGTVYQAMLERGASGDIVDVVPAGKYLDKAAKGDFTKLAASLVPPLPGTDVLRELAAGKKSLRPGWGGKLRDFIEDKAGVTGDDAGSAGRQRMVDMAALATRRTEANKAFTDVAAPKPGKAAESRLTDAQRGARKAELMVEMAKALRDSDGVARLRIISEARRLRRPFSRKDIASLRGRVYHPVVEGDDSVMEE